MSSFLSTSGVRPVPLDCHPVEAAARLRHMDGFVFFDTALEVRGGKNQLSIVAGAPSEVLRGHIERDAGLLREVLQRHRVEAPDCGVPVGFLAGAVDYDGAFYFGMYEHALIYQHAENSWLEVGDMVSRLGVPTPRGRSRALEFRGDLNEADYGQMVARAQEYIAAGDIYQVNLAHRFASPWEGDSFAFYETLRHYSPAPHAAYLELGGRTILSASPEGFLDLSGRAIRTRPIKGTRPRRADAEADERSAFDLITSSKEVAELIMITDLERNDLGRVCEYGSVIARELLALERFEQVFHLVSTVEGRLREEIDHVSALEACFPGGSITGAPKKRAREIIAELEPTPRGLYTGAVGWLGFNGESRFNIAIRTMIIERDTAHFHVGAGIVADSCPEKEWQETLDKAAGILLAAERVSASEV